MLKLTQTHEKLNDAIYEWVSLELTVTKLSTIFNLELAFFCSSAHRASKRASSWALSSVIDWWQHKQKLARANLIVLALGTFHHPSRDYVWKDMQNSLEPTLLKKAIYFKGVVLKGWQTFRGHNRGHFMDKRGDFSWTLLATFRGQKCSQNVFFLGDFSWTFFGWHFVDIFWVNSCEHLSSNKLT